MTLYTFNNVLLREGAFLAQNADCCCVPKRCNYAEFDGDNVDFSYFIDVAGVVTGNDPGCGACVGALNGAYFLNFRFTDQDPEVCVWFLLDDSFQACNDGIGVDVFMTLSEGQIRVVFQYSTYFAQFEFAFAGLMNMLNLNQALQFTEQSFLHGCDWSNASVVVRSP